MFDWKKVKKDFPIFEKRPDLVFLDNASTTQKPLVVLESERDFYLESNANVHRGVYEIAAKADQLYEQVRAEIAEWIGASPDEIIFTKNATEGANLVANGFVGRLKAGDEILITEIEHHANYLPWLEVARRTGAVVRVAKVNADGSLEILPLINEKTKIIAVTQMSNVLGVGPDLEAIVVAAEKVGAKVILDSAQGIVHGGLKVNATKVDAAFFTGHKLFGPMGTGILFLRKNLADINPLLFGGGMIKELPDLWLDAPHKFEAGTPNVAGLAGLSAAIKYFRQFDPKEIVDHEKKLVKMAHEELRKIEGVNLLSPDSAASIVSFVIEGVHPHDIASILGDAQICVRAGHHCAKPLMNALCLNACVRVSFALYNGPEDVDKLITAVKRVKQVFA